MAIQFLILAGFATTLLVGRTDIASSRTGVQYYDGSQSRRPSFWALFSQLSQKQIAENIQRRYLEPLLQEAGLDTRRNNLKVEKLSDLGFSNNVFRVEMDNADSDTSSGHQDNRPQPTVLVAKIFSELAKKRVDPNQFMGEVDALLYRHGLGPKVIAHTEDALLMEYIEGQVLTESMIFDTHNDKGLAICTAVGDALGRMHNLKLCINGDDDDDRRTHQQSQGLNMLWHALDVMLSSIDAKFELTTDSGTTWTLAKLQDTIGNYRKRLETLAVPCVEVGHGDFKLSNVMLTADTNEIRFIDFELTGTHYRGYDLAKFFRSAKQSTSKGRHQHAFWESYHRQTADADFTPDGGSAKSLAESLSQLEWEAELLEPMTWLEAASFFLSMATLDDPSQQDKWNGLAQSRLLGFETIKLDVKR